MKKFGKEIDLNLDESANYSVIKNAIIDYKFLVFRNQKITKNDFIDITNSIGKIEEAWEDQHPENKFIQLLQSNGVNKKNVRKSSSIWHTDRSFTKNPTRYTLLYAKKIEGVTSSTELCDTSIPSINLKSDIIELIENKRANHSFNFQFPDIMRSKGHKEEKIQEQINMYPDEVHPLIRIAENNSKSIYFNELCVNKIVGVSPKDSKYLIETIMNAINKCELKYRHNWIEGDLLMWDNFQTIHRGVGEGGNTSIRKLFRTTVGTG